MASSRYLVSPKQDPSKEKLWNETWKRIDRFLPDLRSDLALEPPSEEESDEITREKVEDTEATSKNGLEAPAVEVDEESEDEDEEAEDESKQETKEV